MLEPTLEQVRTKFFPDTGESLPRAVLYAKILQKLHALNAQLEELTSKAETEDLRSAIAKNTQDHDELTETADLVWNEMTNPEKDEAEKLVKERREC